MARITRASLAVLVAVLVALPPHVPPAASAPGKLPAATIRARERFFGPENVDARGRVRRDRVILSWVSVATMAMAVDGRVVLLDAYIHKGEDRRNYVPATLDDLVALRPQAVFIGHGHFDHANASGRIVARTGATLVGTPEHCDQTREQAAAYAGTAVRVRCVAAVPRGSAPGEHVRNIRPLGPRVGVTVLKHLHSAAEPPDGEGHETTVTSGALPDPGAILLHPPGPGILDSLVPFTNDEGSSLLYRFRVGRFSLVWHDTSGPLREQAPRVLPLLRRLRPVDIHVGSVLGFNDPTNGTRDPVDYVQAIRARVFHPIHHDFVTEYGMGKSMEGVFRREMARRRPFPTDVRWIYDPYDYVRPALMTFPVRA